MTEFIECVKSTLDKVAVDIALNYPGGAQKYVDLTDTEASQELLSSNEEAIVWELLTMEEDPVDPLYSMQFGIGGKTTNDPGRYTMMSLLGAVKAFFKQGDSMDVFDYTPDGDGGTTKQGYVFISNVSVDPQLYDRTSGIRLISVEGRAVKTV